KQRLLPTSPVRFGPKSIALPRRSQMTRCANSCGQSESHSITSSVQASSGSVETPPAVGILMSWRYRLWSTSEFEDGQGHREVVQPDKRVWIYPTGRRGWEGRFCLYLFRGKSRPVMSV